jgi:hypothetical protein
LFFLVNFQKVLIFLNHKTPENWIDESGAEHTSGNGSGGGINRTLKRPVSEHVITNANEKLRSQASKEDVVLQIMAWEPIASA